MAPNFEKRFVAFLDILGFREIIKEPERAFAILKIISEAISNAKSAPKAHKIFPTDAIKLTALSDSIVLSILTGKSKSEAYKNFRFLLSAVEKIQYRCAISNVWMRGGISFGSLLYGDEMRNVMGEALVKAYEIEISAKYPRVIVDPKIIPELFVPLKGPASRQELINEINRDYGVTFYSGKFLFDKSKLESGFHGYFQDDVPLFIDYFHSIYSQSGRINQDALLEFLKTRLYTAQSPEIYAKYRWVVDYLIALAPATVATFEKNSQDTFFSKLLSL